MCVVMRAVLDQFHMEQLISGKTIVTLNLQVHRDRLRLLGTESLSHGSIREPN